MSARDRRKKQERRQRHEFMKNISRTVPSSVVCKESDVSLDFEENVPIQSGIWPQMMVDLLKITIANRQV